MLELVEQLLTGNVLLYVICGSVFALVIGAFAIDRNGSMGIVIALPVVGALVAPITAFLVSMITDTSFGFNLPSLVLPMIVVAVISLLLCYGYSQDISDAKKQLPFQNL